MHRFYFLVALFFIQVACKNTNQPIAASPGQTQDVLQFLSKEEGAKYLVEGEINGYYDHLSVCHMALQTKSNQLFPSRERALEAYKRMTTAQTLDFTSSDRQFLSEVFDSVKTLLDAVNPDLMLPHIKLIKVNEAHYGKTVYYTRGEAIIVPEDIFETPNMDMQVKVMLHEVFHILSRYEEELRDDLYEMIGFFPHGYELVLDEPIQKRLMVNPDGVSMDYAIRLKPDGGGEQVEAIPLIRSTHLEYTETLPNFFDYVSFDLYHIEAEKEIGYVRANEDGSSKMDKAYFPDFFRQIKDNTQYIIHPDEILADNFMHAIKAENAGDFKGFSEEGQVLLKQVLERLKAFKRT